MIRLKLKSSLKMGQKKTKTAKKDDSFSSKRNSIPTTSKSSTGRTDSETPLPLSSVSVSAVSKKTDGKRIYDKRQYCHFHHLERRHSNVVEVAKALSYRKGSKKRKANINFLRSTGNFQHNAAVLKSGQGTLIAKTRPRTQSSDKEYVHCSHCLGLFARKLLWKHLKTCDKRPPPEEKKLVKTQVLATCAIAQPTPSGTPKMFKDSIKSMHQDDVTNILRTDPAILGFGCHIMNKVMGSSTDAFGNKKTVTQQLRSLGRMIKAAREIIVIKTWSAQRISRTPVKWHVMLLASMKLRQGVKFPVLMGNYVFD